MQLDSAIRNSCLKYSSSDVGIILFTDEYTFTVNSPTNAHYDRLYAHPSTKKKDVVTKRLHTQLTFSY